MPLFSGGGGSRKFAKLVWGDSGKRKVEFCKHFDYVSYVVCNTVLTWMPVLTKCDRNVLCSPVCWSDIGESEIRSESL